MGNLFSRKKKSSIVTDELELLKVRLDTIDKNHDSIITKDEFQTWSDLNDKMIAGIKYQYDNEIETIKKTSEDKYAAELMDAKVALQSANDKIADLSKQIDYMKNRKNNNYVMKVGEESENEISDQRVNEIVEQFLSDDKINISLLPDVVERQIYRNVISLAMELLKATLETTKIDFMGHEVSFVIKPL